MTSSRLIARYLIRCPASAVETRADILALEQSVELPRTAVRDQWVADEIVGRVDEIADRGDGRFEVAIGLSTATAPPEAGQLLNILFGNSSLHEDVTLIDVRFPDGYAAAFGGPGLGLAGLRRLTRASSRALTAAALKPQGLLAEKLALLAGTLALGGVDIIKDDHGLADQAFSPFAERVARCAEAVRDANARTGRSVVYAPSLSGSLDSLRAQMKLVRNEGLGAVLVAPMVLGLPAFEVLARENRDVAFLAHPSMAGASRIAPPLLLGRLFRMLGADGTIFPNYGGRFSYSPETCRGIATAALSPWSDGTAELRSTAPVPAGGMTLDRVAELLAFYGCDVVLLIGGSLLNAEDGVAAAAAAFQRKVEAHAE